MSEFKYDVFISYKRADAPWAVRLREALLASRLEPFRDVDSLRAGERWDDQLEEFVGKSRHLILVWSKKTEPEIGDVISHELDYFKFHAAKEWADSRRMVTVMLDETTPPKSFSSLHAHSVRELIGRVPKGPDDLTPADWKKLTEIVIKDLKSNEDKKPVNLLVLTTSAEWWRTADRNSTTRFAISPNRLLSDLKLVTSSESIDEFVKRYGSNEQDRTGWRPFGQEGPTIERIIEDVEAEIGTWARARRKRSTNSYRQVRRSGPVLSTKSSESSGRFPKSFR